MYELAWTRNTLALYFVTIHQSMYLTKIPLVCSNRKNENKITDHLVLLVVLVVVKLDGKLPRTRTTENLATQQTLMKMTLEKRGITFACLPWDRQQRCNLAAAAAYLSLLYVALRLLLYNHRVQNITITRARRRCITSVGVFALSM